MKFWSGFAQVMQGGFELRACGVDFSFTPVLDLDWGESGVIGDRAFARDPRVVAMLARALMQGLLQAGMANCGKHFPGHGFVVTRLSTGIRVGGAVELGGLKLPPNFRRSEAMLEKARRFLPGLKPEGGVQWMGFRPSLPDSLPAIGRARATPHVVYAFGHGHLGLTQAAGTARLVAELLTDGRTAIDIASFSPQRF